jgi:LmbE family N-acetylglucosaminyl deacetylase
MFWFRLPRRRVPVTIWIVGTVAALAVVLLAACLWFDRLYDEPQGEHAPSLVAYCGARSVLAVFAHPDDETFAAGALYDAGHSDGVSVRTVTLTRGENGHPEPHTCHIADLPVVRESELRRFGYTLGIDHQELWHYPDGGLAGAPREEIVGRLVKSIREGKPDLVLTFDPLVGYTNHRDHQVTGELTVEAVRRAADPAYREDLGPPHRARKVAYVIAPRLAFGRFAPAPLCQVVWTQPHTTVSTPVRRGLRSAGWRTHESQHMAAAFPFPAWLLDDFWDGEHYHVAEPETAGQP